jgi:hypothetical protein
MDRGQVHTLEAIVAALLMVTSILFALQITAVTPLSASTSSQHIENQQQASVEGVLAAAAENGDLHRAALAWNGSSGRFFNTTDEDYYTSRAPPNAFGDRLDRAFGSQGIGYNVYVIYYTAGGGRRVQEMVYQGEPSDNAVRAGRTITVTDNTTLYDHETNPTGTELDVTTFYAPDVSTDSPLYNTMRVEVVVWRI